MTGMTNLHDCLVQKQSTADLERKAAKAATKLHWTCEELDLAKRRGKELAAAIRQNRSLTFGTKSG